LALRHARIASAALNDYIARRSTIMRAEITAIVEDIKQSIGLLRRHL
jgi:predicted transcriptional regulator